MKKKIKIYFLENSFDYNGNDLNSNIIGGSEKTLINISSELAKDNKFKITEQKDAKNIERQIEQLKTEIETRRNTYRTN